MIFDILPGRQSQQLVGKEDNNPEHQVEGYFAVPFDHDIAGTEVFFADSSPVPHTIELCNALLREVPWG